MIFRKYVINHLNNSKLDGTISASLNRIKDVDKFVIFEKITDNSNSFTGMGFLNIYLDKNKKNPPAKTMQQKQSLMALESKSKP